MIYSRARGRNTFATTMNIQRHPYDSVGTLPDGEPSASLELDGGSHHIQALQVHEQATALSSQQMELLHDREMKHQATIARKYDALQQLTPVSANKHWVASRNRHLSSRDARKARSGLGALSKGHIAAHLASSSTAGRQALPNSGVARPATKSGVDALAIGGVGAVNGQAGRQGRLLLKAGDFTAFDGLVDFDAFVDARDEEGLAASLMVRCPKARPKTTKGSALAGRRMHLQPTALSPSALAVVTHEDLGK